MTICTSPSLFFERMVPEALRRGRVSLDDYGLLDFRLLGQEPGEWTVDLSRRRCRRGGISRPDFYLEMSSADFRALLAERLVLETAVRQGRVRFIGEPSFLAVFGRLLHSVA